MSQQLVTTFADYTHLQNLLAASRWREADEKTKAFMLAIAKKIRNLHDLTG